MTAQIKKLNKELALSNPKGFTLIELLVVIGILAILLAITLIAINPARQFSQANDTKRRSDVNTILNSIGQYQTDQKGALPGDNADPLLSKITTTVKRISNTGTAGTFADLCSDLVTTYVAALPTDPKSAAGGTPVSNCAVSGGYDTGYTVVKGAGTNNRVTLDAPLVELAGSISVTR